jgi:hypothetical protein
VKAELSRSGGRILAELGWRPESQQARSGGRIATD